jgi:flagellar capping protein FliD
MKGEDAADAGIARGEGIKFDSDEEFESFLREQPAADDPEHAASDSPLHTQVINGWGEQLNGRIDRLDTRMDRLDARMDGLEREVRDGFSTMATGLAQITALLKGDAAPGRD